MADKINKECVNDAVMILSKTFNEPKQKYIEQAIEALKKSLHEKKELTATRADKIIDCEGIFIPFGVPWIDEWFRGGLRPQELMLIGANPHAGKTHILVWCGIQFLLEGYRVLSVIGEDLLADVKSYYEKGINNAEVLQNLWLADMQDVRFGVSEIEAIYEQLRTEGNAPDIVIVDHVDLMKGGSSSQKDWENAQDVMVALKMFAKRTNTIVITASQTNFPSEGNRTPGNMAAFYRAKVGKAANADVILMIDDVVNNEYMVSLTKARGRKKIPAEERQKTLIVDWDNMGVEDVSA
jgi:replicative DNA helicase